MGAVWGVKSSQRWLAWPKVESSGIVARVMMKLTTRLVVVVRWQCALASQRQITRPVRFAFRNIPIIRRQIVCCCRSVPAERHCRFICLSLFLSLSFAYTKNMLEQITCSPQKHTQHTHTNGFQMGAHSPQLAFLCLCVVLLSFGYRGREIGTIRRSIYHLSSPEACVHCW